MLFQNLFQTQTRTKLKVVDLYDSHIAYLKVLIFFIFCVPQQRIRNVWNNIELYNDKIVIFEFTFALWTFYCLLCFKINGCLFSSLLFSSLLFSSLLFSGKSSTLNSESRQQLTLLSCAEMIKNQGHVCFFSLEKVWHWFYQIDDSTWKNQFCLDKRGITTRRASCHTDNFVEGLCSYLNGIAYVAFGKDRKYWKCKTKLWGISYTNTTD